VFVPPIPPGDLARHLWFAATPVLWPAWPFLPVVRHARGVIDLGLMFDARGASGLTGYSSTVFLTNLFALPPALDQFLALPKEVFDGGEELLAAGWRVD
jgi:hypothetical protein